jgi:CubicO group peptidase (beta-lactamase class C family)
MYWIDPENDLILVLLTNSIYPSREYNKLGDLKVREKLLEIIL